MPRLSGVSWPSTFMPNGAIGVARMSNLPHKAFHADNDECIGDILIKFNASSACSTKSSQSESGQLGSRVARVAIK